MNKMKIKFKYKSLSYQENIFCSCLVYDSVGYSKIGQQKSIGDGKKASVYAKNGTYDSIGHFKSLTLGSGKVFVNNWNPDKGILDGYKWGIDGKPDN